MPTYQLILCTCPDAVVAERIAYHLVEQQAAACVNIVPQIKSVYRWQNTIETTQEQLLFIKTNAESYAQISQCIKMHHPYEVPEIIAIDIANGLPGYLQWITENLKY